MTAVDHFLLSAILGFLAFSLPMFLWAAIRIVGELVIIRKILGRQ